MQGQADGKRVAMVTGGDSGIGAACVAELAAAGWDVALIYHSDREGAEAAAAVAKAHGRDALVLQADVGEEEAVEAAFDRTVEALGRPTLLVNSAGLNMSDTPVADMSADQWQRVLATDLTGSFFTCRRFVRELDKHRGTARIINITSIHADAMRAGGADYCAAKAGQDRLTKTLALEVAGRGITVNAIAPGMVLTPMNAEAVDDEGYRRELEGNIPAGRAASPQEIARVALFLASPDAAYITGATIVVDGGLSLLLGQGA